MKVLKTEKEYRAYPAINFSSLSYLTVSPTYYLHMMKKRTALDNDIAPFNIGSALDCLITDGPGAYREQFATGTVDAPTGLSRGFCDGYVHAILEGKDSNAAFSLAYTHSKYKIKVSAAISKMQKSDMCMTYVKEKIEALKDDYTYLSRDEGVLVDKMARKLSNQERCDYYLSRKKRKHLDQYFQFPIVFQINGSPAKGMLDLLFVDHQKKEIHPIDLKTTGKPVLEFRDSFIRWKYYLQASLYTAGVKQWAAYETLMKGQGIGGHDYSDYKVMPFKFIVCSKNGFDTPLIFECSENDLFCGRHGGNVGNRKLKGYLELIDDLLWHKANQLWEFPREVYQYDHQVPLDAFDPSNLNLHDCEQ